MNEVLLRSYETFSEIPHGMLLVTVKSNLMYIRIGRFTFVAREFVDSITNEDTSATYKISYLNVKNQEKILELEIIKSFNNDEKHVINMREDVEIIPLSRILNIKDDEFAVLSLSDIDDILNFKEEFIPGKKNSII